MAAKHFITPLSGYEPYIGTWLWILQDTRQMTLDILKGLDDKTANWVTPDGMNSIGSLLYHIAAIEMSWLYDDIFEEMKYPLKIEELMNYDVCEDDKALTSIIVEPLKHHLNRLKICRQHFLSAFKGMSLEEFCHPRKLDDYELTPEWALHQLIQHEAEHRGQIGEIRKLAEHALGKA